MGNLSWVRRIFFSTQGDGITAVNCSHSLNTSNHRQFFGGGGSVRYVYVYVVTVVYPYDHSYGAVVLYG